MTVSRMFLLLCTTVTVFTFNGVPQRLAMAITCTPSARYNSKCFPADDLKPKSDGQCKVSSATKTGEGVVHGIDCNYWRVVCVQKPNGRPCSGTEDADAIGGRCALEGSYQGQNCVSEAKEASFSLNQYTFSCPNGEVFIVPKNKTQPTAGGSCPCGSDATPGGPVTVKDVCDCE